MVTKAKPEAAKKKPTTAVAARPTTAIVDWKTEMASYAQRAVKMEESTATGNRISTKGGRLSYHDTPLKDNQMFGIILAARVEKTYYEGEYDPEAPAGPVCFAFAHGGSDEDGIAPHEKSAKVQNPTCDGCRWNVFGSAEKGRGKACKDIRGLAIIALPQGASPAETAEAIASNEIATLSVPVMSVRGYSAFVKELALSTGLAPFAFQTRVWLEPDPKSQYRVCFQQAEKKALSEKFYPALLKRVHEAETLLAQPYVYVEREAPAKKSAGKKKPGKY